MMALYQIKTGSETSGPEITRSPVKASIWQFWPMLFMGVCTLALVAGLAGFYWLAGDLTAGILSLALSISSYQFKKLLYLLLAQGVVVTVTALMTTLVPSVYWRLAAITTASAAAIVIVPQWKVPIYIAMVVPLALIIFGFQVNRSLDLFKKFSLRRAVFGHTMVIYLAFSVFLAASIYVYSGQNPDSLQQNINKYIAKTVQSLVINQVKNSAPGKRSSSIITLPKQLNRLVPEDLLTNLVQSYQLSNDLALQENLVRGLKQEVTTQAQGMIEPYLKFLPYILTGITFLTFYQVSMVVNFVYLTVAWITLRLLVITKVVELKEEMQPVEILRLRR